MTRAEAGFFQYTWHYGFWDFSGKCDQEVIDAKFVLYCPCVSMVTIRNDYQLVEVQVAIIIFRDKYI